MELPMREREIDVERKQKDKTGGLGRRVILAGGEGREGIRAEKKGNSSQCVGRAVRTNRLGSGEARSPDLETRGGA